MKIIENYYYRCDADSSALARYVLALLKKDKPGKELKRIMIEQLDVFLGEETTPFVEHLFEAINSEEYLKGATAGTVASITMAKVNSAYPNVATTSSNPPSSTVSVITSVSAAPNAPTSPITTKSANSNDIIIIDDNSYNANSSTSVSNVIKMKDNDEMVQNNDEIRLSSSAIGSVATSSTFVNLNNSNNESRNFVKSSANLDGVSDNNF